MSLSLPIGTIVSGVVAAYATAKNVEPKVAEVLSTVSSLVDAAEKAYSSASGAGASKKAAVLAFTKSAADTLAVEWPALEADIGAIIDGAVSLAKSLA